MEKHATQALARLNGLLSQTEALYHRLARQLGLADSAMRVLYILLEADSPCALTWLCAYSGMSRQTVHTTLHGLEREGFLTLSLRDGKNKEVRLTQEGKALAARTGGRLMQMENEVLASWDERDVETYLALTERFLRDLQQKGQDR